MNGFAKFQPHQIADDKIVIPFGLYFEFVSYHFRLPLILLVYYLLNSVFLNKVCPVYLVFDCAIICIKIKVTFIGIAINIFLQLYLSILLNMYAELHANSIVIF